MNTPDGITVIKYTALLLINLSLILYVRSCIRRGFIWEGHPRGWIGNKIERAKEPAKFKRHLWGFIIFEALFLPLIFYLAAAALWPNVALWSK